MVKIVSKIFNKDMDEYIRTKRSRERRGFFSLGFSMQSESKSMPTIPSSKVEVIYPKAGFISKIMPKKKNPATERQEIAEKVAEMMAEEDTRHKQHHNQEEMPTNEVIVERKDNFFSKIFKSKGPKMDDEDYGGPIEEPALDPETIEVLKLTGKWLMKLDNESKKEFRDSADYAKYKAFLDKYGLTKKKQ